MKILTATSRTQGQRASDFTFVPDGEILRPSFICDGETDPDGPCGCGRSLSGTTTAKATTTFEVTDVDLDRDAFIQVMADALAHAGWLPTSVLADLDEDNRAMPTMYADEIIDAAATFDVGDVIEFRLDHYARRDTPA